MIAYHPFRHLGLKILSVSLAWLLWITIAGDPTVERGLRIPLELHNVPEGVEILGDPPATVDVRVRGSSAILSRLDVGEVVAVLDLRAARPGRRLFHLLNDQVRAPFGVEVAQVMPATVALAIEQAGSRTVPVIPDLDGEPAPGFVVGRVSADPSTVEVVGPVSRLHELTEAITEPVSVQGATEAVHELVTVGVPDSALRLKQPRGARVAVEIVPAPIERTLADVPVRVRNGNRASTLQVIPPAVSVVVRGSRDEMRGIGPEAVEAFVDLAGLGAGRYNLPVRLEVRRSIGVSRIDPATVQVSIR